MKKLRNHHYNLMNNVQQIFLYIFALFTVNITLYCQDGMLLSSSKSDFSETRFFGMIGGNYLMKANPKGEKLGAGLDVGIYYRTAKFLHIGVTAGLHSVQSTRMDYDFNRLVNNNKVNILQMAEIDFSQITYLIPFALCGRFDVANKDIIPFIRVDAGINYSMTESKGVFTKALSTTSQSTQKFNESYSYFAPFIGLSLGVDYSINPSLALSVLLKVHTTHDYKNRDIGLRTELVDFSPQYTILSLGITKKM